MHGGLHPRLRFLRQIWNYPGPHIEPSTNIEEVGRKHSRRVVLLKVAAWPEDSNRSVGWGMTNDDSNHRGRTTFDLEMPSRECQMSPKTQSSRLFVQHERGRDICRCEALTLPCLQGPSSVTIARPNLIRSWRPRFLPCHVRHVLISVAPESN